MSKVEEVARAINACFDQPSPRITAAMPDAEMRAIISEQFARAAIEAMREPKVEMLAAFWRQKNTGTQKVGATGDNCSDYDAWRAAIDAALSEQVPA